MLRHNQSQLPQGGDDPGDFQEWNGDWSQWELVQGHAEFDHLQHDSVSTLTDADQFDCASSQAISAGAFGHFRRSGDLQSLDGFEDEASAVSASFNLHVDNSEHSVGDFQVAFTRAYNSLPVKVDKPIWEQGVWSRIFGDDPMSEIGSLESQHHRPVPNWITVDSAELDAAIVTDRKRKLPFTEGVPLYASVVINKPDSTWQEERESLLQSALKRWVVTLCNFAPWTIIRCQLDECTTDVERLTLVADYLRGRAPATLLKRVRSIEKVCLYLGDGRFPPNEQQMYKFFCAEREAGAPASRMKSHFEALVFCHHVFSVSELGLVVNSKRCHGVTVSEQPHAISQASPLQVSELRRLHEVLETGDLWDQVFAGAALFAVYARSRWADLMHCCDLILDRDRDGNVCFLEGHTMVHKTMHAEVHRHRFLPLVAPSPGVVEQVWPQLWLEARWKVGAGMPPQHPVMPAPMLDGTPGQRPISSSEAGSWLKLLLYKDGSCPLDRKLTSHSLKATCLSYAAKYGLDAVDRLQLGYHGSGLRMVHTYSRDASARPLDQLCRVLEGIRKNCFDPDSTRSGRFLNPEEASVQTAAVDADKRALKTEVIDLEATEDSKDLESDASPRPPSEHVTSSSSTESSEEEFQERRKPNFDAPVAPDGHVFWQHRKLKTLHLTRPECFRVFLCGRPVGKFHSKEGMTIRFDTPVCRLCMNHAEKWGA